MKIKQALTLAMAAVLSFSAVAPAVAQDRDHRGSRRDDRRDGPRQDRWDFRGDRHWGGGPPQRVIIRPRPPYPYYRPYPVPRSRWYGETYVSRPYGVLYPGFGFYYRDNDAARFLGLTALSFIALSALNESQQRAHEEAMIRATSAPVGDAVEWSQGGNRGSVVPLREGQTPDGRQCREFQQNVTIGGREEEAYGTACMQPDGTWQVVRQTN